TVRDQLLFGMREVFDRDLRPFVAKQNGKSRAELLGGLKLLSDFLGCEWVIEAVTAISNLIDMRERIRTAFRFSDHNVDVDLVLGRDCLLHPLSRPFVVANQFTQNNVAHGESDCRQFARAITKLTDKTIVTTAASERP